MASTTGEAVDPVPIKSYLDHPPPQYEAASPRISAQLQKVVKATESVNLTSGPWLVRRTSIVIESHSSQTTADDQSVSGVSSTGTRHEDEVGGISAGIFRRAISRQDSMDSRRAPPWHACKPFDTGFGTSVLIEAGKPRRAKTERQMDMKGLEQAASVKRWPGGGRPGEAWGKLTRVGG